jgi:hypothetical protein
LETLAPVLDAVASAFLWKLLHLAAVQELAKAC